MSNLQVVSPAGRGGLVDQGFARKVAEALNDPFTQMQLLNQFWDYLLQRIATGGVPVPVSQLTGFAGFQFQAATRVNTAETTASTSYTDLATVGPTLSGLSDGQYAVFYGFVGFSDTSGAGGNMSVSVNSAAASDDDAAAVSNTAPNTAMTLVTKTLDAGSNEIKAKYRSSSSPTGTMTFQSRWLVAVKYANR